MFILGTRYLSIGVLRHVFGVRYAVSVLVTCTHRQRAPLRCQLLFWAERDEVGTAFWSHVVATPPPNPDMT